MPTPPLIMPPAGDPAMPAYLAAVAAKEVLAAKFDYFMPSPSKMRFDQLEAKMSADTMNQLNIAAGIPNDGSPRFVAADQIFMTTCLGVVALETKFNQKETDVIGDFLILVKNTVSLSLGQLIDAASETDRPGFERRPNFVLRTFLEQQEPLCRGNSKNYQGVLQEIFNSIGKAESILQATYVLDQVDYFRNIFQAYVDLHPGAIPQIPTDEDYLGAIFYRLKNSGKLHELHKLLQKVLLSTGVIEYSPTVSGLRLALQNNLPNIFDPSSLPSNSSSSASSKSESNPVYSHSQSGNSSISSPKTSRDDFFQSYLSLSHGDAAAFHNQQANLGFGGAPVPSPQPGPSPLYPGSAAWQPRPPGPPPPPASRPPLHPTCKEYPLCNFHGRDGLGFCRYQHVSVTGAKIPALEQIQGEASAQQNAMEPSLRANWHPSQDLVDRTVAALSGNPADNMSMLEGARKKNKYSH
jgi:hypothetical protein